MPKGLDILQSKGEKAFSAFCKEHKLSPNDIDAIRTKASGEHDADALAKALEIEDKIMRFYSDAAEHSMSLMADVPRNFVIIAKKRRNRIEKLKSLSSD